MKTKLQQETRDARNKMFATRRRQYNELRAEAVTEARFENYVLAENVQPVTRRTRRGVVAEICGTGYRAIVRVVRDTEKDAVNDVLILAGNRPR